mgnify:CR=1 FL=1
MVNILDYIELNDIPIAGVESASISLWFKTNSSSHTSGEGHLVQIGKNLSGKFGFGEGIVDTGDGDLEFIDLKHLIKAVNTNGGPLAKSLDAWKKSGVILENKIDTMV